MLLLEEETEVLQLQLQDLHDTAGSLYNTGGGGGGAGGGTASTGPNAGSNGGSGVAVIKELSKASGVWSMQSQFSAKSHWNMARKILFNIII